MWLRPKRLPSLWPWIACFWFSLLGGCSATGEPFGKLQSPSGTEAQIVFYRPDQLRGVSALPVVLVDDEEIGKLRNAGWLSAQVQPGAHRLMIDSGPGNGKILTIVGVAAGETIVFRANPGSIHLPHPIWLLNPLGAFTSAGRVYADPWTLERVANEVAEEELKGLRRSQ